MDVKGAEFPLVAKVGIGTVKGSWMILSTLQGMGRPCRGGGGGGGGEGSRGRLLEPEEFNLLLKVGVALSGQNPSSQAPYQNHISDGGSSELFLANVSLGFLRHGRKLDQWGAGSEVSPA